MRPERFLRQLRLILLTALFCGVSLAADANLTKEQEPFWAIGIGVRTATIPYAVSNEVNKTVSTLIPYIRYEGKHFFLRGIEGGGHLYKDDKLELNLFSRLRFVDIPAQYQNELQLDTFDLGAQLRYDLDERNRFHLELMSDTKRNPYANLRYTYRYEKGAWQLYPNAEVVFKSSGFNSYYYGLDREHVDAGVSFKAGLKARYHVVDNAYLLAIATHERLDAQARSSSAIDVPSNTEVFAGIELGQDKSKPTHPKSGLKEFLRLDMGFGTISDFEDTVMFNRKKDIYNNKLTTIKYGVPLSDRLLTLPIDVYLLNGFTYHWTSEVQPDPIYEYTIAFKIYYTIPLPWRIRLGAAEGFSWVSDITYLERRDGELEGYKSSKFLNHLETSIELSLGDIFGPDLEPFWFGTGVHHRSAIYLLSSQYGRQEVGSNYYTYFLKWEF